MAINFKPERLLPFVSGGGSRTEAELPQPSFPATSTAAVEPGAAFVWGERGNRRSAAELAIARELANKHAEAGMDFSPVTSWTQGFARVAQGWLAHDEMKDIRRATDANAVGSRAVAELLAQGEQVSVGQIAQAASDPYIDPIARELLVGERERRAKAAEPQYFTAGSTRAVYDPITKQTQVLYQAPSDAEDYAVSLGYEPGTSQFNTAMQDYVLRGNGPTAFDYHVDLEHARQGNRVSLEGLRQNNRLSLRQTPTYANLHPRQGTGRSGGAGRANTGRATLASTMAPILAKVARGESLSPSEQQAWNMYRPPNRGRKALTGAPGGTSDSIPEGSTATGPNGQKLVRRGGKWMPLK